MRASEKSIRFKPSKFHSDMKKQKNQAAARSPGCEEAAIYSLFTLFYAGKIQWPDFLGIQRFLALRTGSVLVNVLDDLHIRSCDQAVAEHFVQKRQEQLNFLVGIDDGDHDGRVGRKREQMRAPDQRAGAVPFDPAKHSGSRNVQLPALFHDRPVERLPMPLI